MMGMRQERAYVSSSGPVVNFHVNGRFLGDEVRLPAQGGEVTIEGEASALAPLRKVTIYRDGKA